MNDQASDTSADFELALFRLAAIKKAAYRFAGEFQVTLETVKEGTIRVSLSRLGSSKTAKLDPRDLHREVLDQELRELVADETKSVRDLILAQAFSELPLLDPDGENGDYREDPLNIADEPSKSKARP